ncbi:MAG: hypothetical protein RL318_1132 [Fibrobacterota bacterium]|jgi:hypothetical protein
MRKSPLIALVLTIFAQQAHSLALGAGIGRFSGTVQGAKTSAKPWEFQAPALALKVTDPSGSLLSLLSGAAGNYGRMTDAQRRARESAEKGGSGTATYEMRTSVNSTGSTQTLELLWADGGSFTFDDGAPGRTTDDAPDLMALQLSINSDITAWNGLGGIPLSALLYWKMVMGYLSAEAKGPLGYTHSEDKAWFTFPFGAAVVFDAPLSISPKVFAGYDPITGLISIWSKNVHQAWEYGAGATWTPFKWLIVDATFTQQSTNVDNNNVWNLRTTSISTGAQVDFDGF